MRSVARHLAVAIIGAATGFGASVPGGQAQTFDGITVIELKDAVGQRALGASRADYILTFVSGLGTYAATLGGLSDRGCVAWAREGSYTGASITFGLAAEDSKARSAGANICLPFTLTFEDAQTVRVSADNLVPVSNIPGAPAPRIRYSRKRPVIDHIPLRALDWGSPSFARHHIQNVRLGPVIQGRGISYDLGPLQRSTGGIFKGVQAAASSSAGGLAAETVIGRAAGRELTGWPWDAVFALWSAKYLNPVSTRTAFEKSIVERYGEPGFTDETSGLWYWLYDLDGELLGREDGARGNCLHTMDLWERPSLVGQNTDLGPWGCSLVMTLAYGSASTVSSYRIELISGYAKAINHFLTRLEELKAMRDRMRAIGEVEPKL